MSNKKTRYFVAVMGAILAVGLGTGLVASYMGLPVSVFSSAAGPEELQYVPADAAVVAYANVREVMSSQFRQRFKDIEPSENDKNEFEEKTGLNLEQDVDSIVAAVMPKDGMANNPAGSSYHPVTARVRSCDRHGGRSVKQRQALIVAFDAMQATHPDEMAFGFFQARSRRLRRVETVKAALTLRLEPQHRLEQRHDEAE
jgi:hypothetical protein